MSSKFCNTGTIAVYNDVLSDADFYPFSMLLGNDFPWFYNEFTDFTGDNKGRFIHSFYSGNMFNSDKAFILDPLLNKFYIHSLMRVKANFTTIKDNHKKTGAYHKDIDPNMCEVCDKLNCSEHENYQKSSITDQITNVVFYLNTNNGYTEFESGEIVPAVKNSMVVFNNKIKHRAVEHTEGDYHRIVINMNFL